MQLRVNAGWGARFSRVLRYFRYYEVSDGKDWA